MIVDLAGVPVDRVTASAKMPEAMGVTRRFRVIAVCERFGWSLDYVEAMEPGLLAEMLVYSDVRAAQEASVAAALAGVRVR